MVLRTFNFWGFCGPYRESPYYYSVTLRRSHKVKVVCKLSEAPYLSHHVLINKGPGYLYGKMPPSEGQIQGSSSSAGCRLINQSMGGKRKGKGQASTEPISGYYCSSLLIS